MATGFYTTDQVDPILKAAKVMIGTCVDVIDEQAADIARLNQELSVAKAASGNNVQLDKVASARTSPLAAEKAAAFASALASHGIIDDDKREKYASNFISSPSFLADVALKALKLSEAPVQQGRGIKSASSAAEADTPDSKSREAEIWREFFSGE